MAARQAMCDVAINLKAALLRYHWLLRPHHNFFHVHDSPLASGPGLEQYTGTPQQALWQSWVYYYVAAMAMSHKKITFSYLRQYLSILHNWSCWAVYRTWRDSW